MALPQRDPSRKGTRFYPESSTICKMCKEWALDLPRLTCQLCEMDFHLKCLQLTEREAVEIAKFVCHYCTVEHNVSTEFISGQTGPRRHRVLTDDLEPTPGPSYSTQTEREPLQNLDQQASQSSQSSSQTTVSTDTERYDVEKVTGVRKTKAGKTEYKIRWTVGKPKETWEPEDNCRGCVDKINEFLAIQKLPKCTLTPRYGASSAVTSSLCNRRNWVQPQKVLAAVNKFDRSKQLNPPVKIFSGALDESAIQIIGSDGHLFVSYFSPISQEYYIADGSNDYFEQEDVRSRINTIIGHQAVGVNFVGQSKIDHCASSAVLIALGFRRFYRNKQIPSVIKSERTVQQRIINEFHSQPSRTMESPQPLRNLVWEACPICGKKYSQRNRSHLNGHILGCKNRKN